MLRRWVYRSRQFFGALLRRVSDEEMEEAYQVLGPGLYPVFTYLPGQYRRHGLTVYHRLKQSGCKDTAILQAALLHDAGKYDPPSGKYVMLPHRVAVVLLEALPAGRRLVDWLSQPLPRRGRHGLSGRLRFPFYLSKHHAELGSRIAQEHGASPEVVKLIADHHRYERQSAALSALRGADDRS